MRKLRLLLAIAPVCCVLLVPSLAKADPACGAMNLTSLISTACTIGDKTFTFTKDQLSLNGVTVPMLSDFVITPDASTPLNPSFTISAAPAALLTLPSHTNPAVTLTFVTPVSPTHPTPTTPR